MVVHMSRPPWFQLKHATTHLRQSREDNYFIYLSIIHIIAINPTTVYTTVVSTR